jgi:hypothetical protein
MNLRMESSITASGSVSNIFRPFGYLGRESCAQWMIHASRSGGPTPVKSRSVDLTRQLSRRISSLRVRRLPDGMRRPVSAGCDKLPMFDVLKAQ